MHALNEFRKGNGHKDNSQAIASKAIASDKTKQLPGNKLITEYFQGRTIDRNWACSNSKTAQNHSITETPNKEMRIRKSASLKAATSRSIKNNGRFKDIPSWCCIPGTLFRVVYDPSIPKNLISFCLASWLFPACPFGFEIPRGEKHAQ